jgi:hypothetical protein
MSTRRGELSTPSADEQFRGIAAGVEAGGVGAQFEVEMLPG